MSKKYRISSRAMYERFESEYLYADFTAALSRSFSSILGVFFVLISVSCGPGESKSTLAEDVVLRNLVTEVGEVWPNQKVRFEFDISNQSSSEDFFIEEIAVSCACTVLAEVGREIAPKSSLSIPGEVVFGRAPGIFTTSVAVRVRRKSGKEGLMLRHQISGTIISLVNYDRNSIAFGTFAKNDDILNKSLKVSRGVRGDSLSSVEIDCLKEIDWITAKVLKSGNKDYLAEIFFELDPTLCPPGEFSESFRVVLKDAEGVAKSEQEFPVTGKRMGDHSITPLTLLGWENSLGDAIEFELNIVAKNKTPIESVKLFDSSDEEISIVSMRYSETRATVDVLGKFPDSSREGIIRVSVDSQGEITEYSVAYHIFENSSS